MQDDSGMALVAVIGVMIVGLLLTSLIVSSVTTGIGVTSGVRAEVQSQASVESGVAVARAAIERDNTSCSAVGGHFVSATGVTPKYDVQVYNRTSATGAWAIGCPGGAATQYKVTGTGAAQSKGVVGVTQGDASAGEAIFSAPVASATVTSSGQAVYSYGGATASGAGLVTSVSGSTASVFVAHGDLVCDGGAGIAGDVVVPDGKVTISGSCKVGGSIYTTGVLSMGGGATGNKVGGNIVAKTITSSGASAPIGGSIWITGTDPSTISSMGAVAGGIYAVGSLSISDTAVTGNIIVGGVLTQTGNVGGSIVGGTINITGGSGTISGGAYAPSGTFTNTWGRNVTGVVAAKTLSITGGTASAAYAQADAALNSALAYPVSALTKSGSGSATPLTTGWRGTLPAGPAAPVAPTIPTVAGWVDYTYSAANWPTYTVVTLTGATCTTKQVYAAMQTIGSAKGIIDARTCTNPVDLSSGFNQDPPSYAWVTNDLVLQNDLVILTKKFAMSNGSWNSASNHSLWLIQEDTTANHAPDCNGQSMSVGGGGLTIYPNVKLMIYTPCAVTITSSQAITGQVYSNGSTVTGGATLTFYQVGLPGVNLDTGTVATPSTAPRTWNLDYVRNIPG